MLSSDLIFLRPLETEDLDFLYALENDPAVWSVSDTLVPVSRYNLRQYLDNAAADFQEVRQLRLVICLPATQEPVGTLDIFDFNPLHQRAGVGIIVLGQYRRRGYAQAALDLLMPYAQHVLRLHQLFCTIAMHNKASIRLFKQASFKKIGVRREWLRTADGWHDVLEMQRLLGN
jgi:diamine N-acetyltransferase